MDDNQSQNKKRKFHHNVILRMKIQVMIKKWRKMVKKSKLRLNKLKEWSSTEQSYYNKLIVLRDQVRNPLKQAEMITEFEEVLIFSNLDAMIQLSQQMKEKIDGLLATWNPVTTLLAPTVESLSSYLKIYKEYSNNFEKADSIIQKLKQSPKFQEVVKVNYVEDYLIKPIQRPLQYKLFTQDYLNALPKDHKDYPKLELSLKKLLKIANQINDYVEEQIRAQKIIRLQKTFGDLVESTRVFKSEFQVMYFDMNCRLYVLNDLILVSKLDRGREERLMKMYLCGSSYVIKKDDNVNFKNRLYICGTYQSIHLTFPAPVDFENAFKLIDTMISDLYQKQYNRFELISKAKEKRQTMVMNRHSTHQEFKWKEQHQYKMKLRIQVLNVEKRLFGKQWRIVYMVKIQLGRPQTIYQIRFYDIEEFRIIEKYLHGIYPHLKIPSIDSKFKGMAYDDVKVDFAKYAEYRSIIIENFLNFVLRCKEVSRRPQFILLKLRIHECFWDYLNKFELECGCQACLHSEVYNGIKFYYKQQATIKKKTYQFCILNSFNTQNAIAEFVEKSEFKKFDIEQRLLWASCKQRRIDYGLLNREDFGEPFNFSIHLNLSCEEADIVVPEATVNDTARNIIEEICERRGINTSRDLALVFVCGEFQYYLDDDEYIYDTARYLEGDFFKEESSEKRSTIRASIFAGFSKSFDDLGEWGSEKLTKDKPKLCLRKIYTFKEQDEEMVAQANFQRYPIMVGEFLVRVKNETLVLEEKEMQIFCALMYLIEEFNTIVFFKTIFLPEDKLRRYLPESAWKRINEPFLKEVRVIVDEQAKLCSNITVLYRYLIRQFGNKQGWLTQYFPVEIINDKTLQIKGRTQLLGVNYRHITLSSKQNMNLKYLNLYLSEVKCRVSGSFLFIDTQNGSYQFSGNNFLLLTNMIEKYQLLEEFERAKQIKQ